MPESPQLIADRAAQKRKLAAQKRQEVQAMPEWLRRSTLGKASEISQVQQIIKQRNIHTICEEGRCPNRGECYSQGTATFLLMGPVCTRSCAFVRWTRAMRRCRSIQRSRRR